MILLFACTFGQAQPGTSTTVLTSDINNFWRAYDKITTTTDPALQHRYLHNLYLDKGTPGLSAIIRARNYTPNDYINAINNYPQFWNSIRKNTLKASRYAADLEAGIGKLRKLYPGLRPAKIYFTIGAFRTNGTAMDSLVLIGSELAMTDEYTVATEFPTEQRTARQAFFKSNPIKNLVLLNIHEYVHTQQKPIVHNLLSEVLYEGVAEFVSVKALGIPSATPAIEFGKRNTAKLRAKFEQEMFYTVNQNKWIWSNAPNEFGVRDLGYYIGYQISELYYENAKDKQLAIAKLIQLDYSNETEIESFVNSTGFFSASLDSLEQSFEKKRPTITRITPFENHSENVSPETKKISFEFSEPLNGRNTGIDYGPLGENYFPKIHQTERLWSNQNRTWTINVNLEPGKHYQFLIDNNFRNTEGIPLKPLMVEFKTAAR